MKNLIAGSGPGLCDPHGETCGGNCIGTLNGGQQGYMQNILWGMVWHLYLHERQRGRIVVSFLPLYSLPAESVLGLMAFDVYTTYNY